MEAAPEGGGQQQQPPQRPRRRHWAGWRPFLLVGLPLLTVVVGASLGLAELQRARMERRDERQRRVTQEEMLTITRRKRKPTMEDIYREIVRDVDTEHWEQVRVPRPPGVR